MKTPILPLILSACALLAIACTQDKPKEWDGLNVFAETFKKANQAESIEPMLELYYLVGADQRTVDLLRGALRYELGLPIDHIEFEPLSGAPEETIHFTHNGVLYGSSIPPICRMRVIYDVEDNFTSLFTLGLSPEKEWRIVCATPKPTLDF